MNFDLYYEMNPIPCGGTPKHRYFVTLTPDPGQVIVSVTPNVNPCDPFIHEINVVIDYQGGGNDMDVTFGYDAAIPPLVQGDLTVLVKDTNGQPVSAGTKPTNSSRPR